MSRWRSLAALLLLSALALATWPFAAVMLAACCAELPASLREARPRVARVFVLDRDGRLVREVAVPGPGGVVPVDARALYGPIVPALIAAEDARFDSHLGVDLVAVARAVVQNALDGRVVSGASTLTQQLSRALVPRPRTFAGKLREMALALRLEASFSKESLLREYLSRIEFAPNVVGVEAASRRYFDKPASSLDWAEAAALAALPRGPVLYDPERRPQLLERRRLRVLSRLAASGRVSARDVERAELTPVRLAPRSRSDSAQHLAFAIAVTGGARHGATAVTTTLDGDLQREAEAAARRAMTELRRRGASAVAALVLDNATGDVLAYLGSPDYFAGRELGANDGVIARRQPGSALKPFLYAAAMESLGYGPATLLWDVETRFDGGGKPGNYAPRNYDKQFHGPVLLRQALASSLNVPAAAVAETLGPPRFLDFLHRFGFASLDEPAGHYGVGLALGDGEVTLLELTGAYATLARGGVWRAPRLVRSSARGGEVTVEAPSEPHRILRPEIASLVTRVLSDDAARAEGFGRDSVLSFDFPVAAKTGTSKGYRDNWAVGYSAEVTVGVWVGNFDGTSMAGVSGITGAGPLFAELMRAAMRGREPAPLVTDSGLHAAEVCALSGARPGAACRERRREWFLPGREPAESCELHALAARDGSGALQDPRCGGVAEVFERYPERYRAWALAAGRPVLEGALSSSCPPELVSSRGAVLNVTYPPPDASFVLDPDAVTRQEIVIEASAPGDRVTLEIDGRAVAELAPPFRHPWRLQTGSHTVLVRSPDGRASAPVRFRVRCAGGGC